MFYVTLRVIVAIAISAAIKSVIIKIIVISYVCMVRKVYLMVMVRNIELLYLICFKLVKFSTGQLRVDGLSRFFSFCYSYF